MKIDEVIDRDELQKILEVCWGKSSFLTKCVDNSASLLPSISEFTSLLNGYYVNNEWHTGKNASISASRISKKGTVDNLSQIAVHDAEKLYNKGYTLCFGDVSKFSPALTTLKNSAISSFGGDEKALITCYLTPPNCSGLLHYDRQHNFFIQSEGNKKWTVSERAAVESPYDNLVYPGATESFFDTMHQQGYHILKPHQCGKVQYQIYQNQTLYVPPGFYHVAETGEQPSLHFTLTLEPLSFWSEINPFIFRTLLSNCGSMNKDVRMLSKGEAEKHFDICIRELRESLSEEIIKQLLLAHNKNHRQV